MALKTFQILKLAEYFDRFRGQRVGKILQYGKDVLSFRLQKGGRVVISLDNQNPLVFIGGDEEGKTSLSTNASAQLRKKLGGASFDGAEQVNGDRVLKFRFIGTNDIFQEERFSLVVELIPTKANMALLDEQGKILFAYRSNNILDPRPIFYGIHYEPPLKKESFNAEESDFDAEEYFRLCHDVEDRLQQQRKNNLYQDFFRQLKAKIKSLKRKIAQIEEDIASGNKHLHDVDYGNYLLTFQNEIPSPSDHFDYYGTIIPLDPRKSVVENANDFFKKAKKAKNAIALGEENIFKAKEELSEAERLLSFAQACDEETLQRLLGQSKNTKQSPKAANKRLSREPKDLPYVAKIGDTTFYFGKSAKQNDALSFLYATKGDYLWFHVKNQTGSHLILPQPSPSDQAIQYACELTLLSSSKEDGEVQYTEHKNIRKGSVKGQVILGSYLSAYIRSISKEAREAYELAISKERE